MDRSLVLLLSARLNAAHRALRLRAARHLPLTDPAQERRVLQRSRRWAREVGLPEVLVDRLFRTLIEEGKARFRHLEELPDSPFVTVLLAAPGGAKGALQRAPRPQLVAVPASR